jgi:hypothetical protein
MLLLLLPKQKAVESLQTSNVEMPRVTASTVAVVVVVVVAAVVAAVNMAAIVDYS